ncbi:MAG: TIR domain-containing protein [Oscillospiraceae bacterium]|nr:TIR domain-containing protein [Oscillospiraceae bacterium]
MNGLKPYQGNEPYLFISYAHADEQAVGSVLEHLEQNGVRFWYDDGIEAGSEWPEYIAERLASANMMIAFVSNAYAVSDNCRKEMHYAVSNKIKTINVFLEDADLTPGMTLQIGNIFALMKYRMEEREFYDRLDQALQIPGETGQDEKSGKKAARKSGKTKDRKNKKTVRNLLIAGLGILLAAAVFCGVWFIPAAASAAKSVTVSREEALTAAEACFEDLVGEETAQSFYVDYITRRLRHDGSVFKGVYIYNVEFQNQNGTEYKIEVNAASGKTVIRDID